MKKSIFKTILQKLFKKIFYQLFKIKHGKISFVESGQSDLFKEDKMTKAESQNTGIETT